jgi:hypothetical protein
LENMKRRSPTLEGFRVMFREPALGMAEIAWRWSLGAAASLLLSFAFLQYLDTLPVTNADLLFLRSRQPFLISQAIAHIFRGSGLRLVMVMAVTLAALAAGWVVTASFSRAASLKWIVDYFSASGRESSKIPEPHLETQDLQSGKGTGQQPTVGKSWLAALIGLNFFRVALIFATVLACVGATMLAGLASSPKDPQPGLVFLLTVPLVCLVWLFWSVLNWFLSLASVFAVRDGQDTFGALAAAVRLCRGNPGSVSAVGFWFGLAHLTAFIAATMLVAFPMAFAGVIPAGMVLGGMLLVTLLYFALVDFLYAGRLAAYVAIADLPEIPTLTTGDTPPQDAPELPLTVVSEQGVSPSPATNY